MKQFAWDKQVISAGMYREKRYKKFMTACIAEHLHWSWVKLTAVTAKVPVRRSAGQPSDYRRTLVKLARQSLQSR